MIFSFRLLNNLYGVRHDPELGDFTDAPQTAHEEEVERDSVPLLPNLRDLPHGQDAAQEGPFVYMGGLIDLPPEVIPTVVREMSEVPVDEFSSSEEEDHRVFARRTPTPSVA
ncbi:hypothetical protein EIP86_011019 [Pleurotus ostreatoroseus]|nr:hypothetical protein EIP86_011019 [Pleurotus ostreatoroseus]